MFVLWQSASCKLNEIGSLLKWLNGTSNSLSHLDLQRSGLKSQKTTKKCPLDVRDAFFGCNSRAYFVGSANFDFTLTGLMRQTETSSLKSDIIM